MKVGAAALVAVGIMAVGLDGRGPALAAGQAPQAEVVARGDYLTHNVAMCIQCHTPRDEQGRLIESKAFGGASIPFVSPFPARPWAVAAPAIGGLTGFTDEQIIALLTTGAATGRQPPKPPMPPFRLTQEDAEAVVAYLRTITLR